MLPKVTRMLDLITVIMLLMTAGYVAIAFSHVLSTTVVVTLVGGAFGYGFGYCKKAATARELTTNEQYTSKEYIA